MDIDNSGSVSLRELNRVLMGDVEQFISCEFSHPDTGILWEMDDENCVTIASIENNSPASKFPFLIPKMKLAKINNTIIPQNNEKSLQQVYTELLKLRNGSATLEFLEPALIINKFCCWIDIEVDKNIFSVELPIGAIYNLDVFKEQTKKCFEKTHDILKYIDIDIVLRKKQMEFKSSYFPFRLLFGTGPNCKLSCRYIIGFNSEDTVKSKYHTGF
jgi:hypothetical protein